MSADGLSSRAIIGSFYNTLDQDSGAGWVSKLAMKFNSDQSSEEYKWLGNAPKMREWIGGRQAKGWVENGLIIKNKQYEATVYFYTQELRRDKTGQTLVRINELAQGTNTHWASLLSTLMLNGDSTVCYDGQFFFDTDHSEGDSGTQSNEIDADISTFPATVHGVTTAPSIEEMQQSVFKGITQILSFKDDQGEPMNEGANKFIVMVPPSLFITAGNAFKSNPSNDINQMSPLSRFTVDVEVNSRLTWTDKFMVARTDGQTKPFIQQAETDVVLKVQGAGSQIEFDKNQHAYGVDCWRNVGYGFWQHACLVTMI